VDEELKTLIREYLDLHKREVEALEASVKTRDRATGWRMWFPIFAFGIFLGLMLAMFAWFDHR